MEILSKNILELLKNTTKKRLLLIRHGESLGNHSGSIIGWTDSKLTINGRAQANSLYEGLYQHITKFDGIYSSDLSRAYDTAVIALGFDYKYLIKKDHRLRELYYGKEEGVHFDSLPAKDQERINNINYKAEGGESWLDVQKRSRDFFKNALKTPGNYMIFTHAGLICTHTYELGLQEIIGNCSCIGLECNEESSIPEKILFKWELPPKSFE